MKDLFSLISPAVLLPAAAYNADNTPAAVALAGFTSALVEISVGVGGITFDDTNKVEFKLTHSLDGGTTYTAVAAADVQLPAGQSVGTGGIVKSLTAAHAAAAVYKVGYIGGGTHLKLLADFSGTHGTATPMAATVARGGALRAPV